MKKPGPAFAAGISRSLGDAFHSAVSAVKRAASPARQPVAAVSDSNSRSSSPTRSGQAADTRDLVAAVAAASAMNGTAVLPGMAPLTFPKASAGQVPGWGAEEEAAAAAVPDDWRQAAEAEAYAPAGTQLDADAAAAAALAAIDAALADSSAAAPAPVSSRSASRSSWRDEVAAEAVPVPAAPSTSRSRSVTNWRDQVEAEAARAATAAASADASAVNRQGGDNGRTGSSRRKQPLRTASPERAAAAAEAMRRLRSEAAGADDDGLRVGVMGGEDKFFGGDSGEWDEVQLERRRESLRAAAGADNADEEAEARGGRERELVTVGVSASRAAAREKEVGATAAAADPRAARGRSSSRRVVARTLSPERTSEVAAAMRRMRLEAGLPPNDGSGDHAAGGFASPSNGHRASVNGNGSANGNGSGASRYTPSVSPSASAVVPRDWRRELQSSAGEGAESSGAEGQAQPQRRAGSGRARVVVSAGSRAPSNWRQQVDGGSNGNGNGNGNGQSSPRHATPANLSPSERLAREARMRDWRARV